MSLTIGEVRALLLRAILPLIVDQFGPITVTISDGKGNRTEFSFPQGAGQMPAEVEEEEEDSAGKRPKSGRQIPGEPAEHEGMRPVHRALLAVATQTPMPVKVLIRACNYGVNSTSRAAVTDLVRWKMLVKSADGVCLPGSGQIPG